MGKKKSCPFCFFIDMHDIHEKVCALSHQHVDRKYCFTFQPNSKSLSAHKGLKSNMYAASRSRLSRAARW